MLSTILSVFRKQAALVISYYKCIDIEGTAPGVGQGKELSLSAEDGVHLNPVAITFWRPWVGPELEAIG